MEAELKKSSKKKFIVIAMVLAVIALAVGIGIIVYFNSPSQRMKRQIDLGNRYLGELKYEEAIAAFSEALAIDARSETALSGLADAYMGNAELHASQAAYTTAIENYQAVLDIAPERTAAYEGMAAAYAACGEYEQTAEILERLMTLQGEAALSAETRNVLCNAYETLAEAAVQNGNDARAAEIYARLLELRPGEARYMDAMEQARVRLEFAEYRDALQEMAFNIANSEKYNFADTLVLSDEFLALTQTLAEPVFFPADDGLTIGIYPGGYIYYGEMRNEKREGDGYWYHGDMEGLSRVTCPWKNDLPNGEARIEGWLNEARMGMENDPDIIYIYVPYTLTACNLTDGKYDGNAYIRREMDDGEVHEWDVPFAGGYATVAEGHVCRNCESTLYYDVTYLNAIDGIR